MKSIIYNIFVRNKISQKDLIIGNKTFSGRELADFFKHLGPKARLSCNKLWHTLTNEIYIKKQMQGKLVYYCTEKWNLCFFLKSKSSRSYWDKHCRRNIKEAIFKLRTIVDVSIRNVKGSCCGLVRRKNER